MIWRVTIMNQSTFIVDLAVTKVPKPSDDFQTEEKFRSPGGAFDTPQFTILRFEEDRDFYLAISKAWKQSQSKFELSEDANRVLKKYSTLGIDLFPEMFVWV